MNIARNNALLIAIINGVATPNNSKTKKIPYIGSKRNGSEKERHKKPAVASPFLQRKKEIIITVINNILNGITINGRGMKPAP
jgi:hypothetical protein